MLLFLLVLFFSWCESKSLPLYLEKCYQSDPNSKQCHIKAVNIIKTHFKKGIPEFGLPSMDPLILPEIVLGVDNNFKATFKDIQIFHIDEMIVKDLNINLAENSVSLKLFFPELRIYCKYNIEGKLLFLQLNGDGPVNGNLTNVEAHLMLEGHRYKKEQKDYIKFDSLKVDEKVIKPKIRFDGLFKDNPELTDQTNSIFNDNIDDIIQELRPTIHLAVRETVLGFISRIFDKYSVQELFPE